MMPRLILSPIVVLLVLALADTVNADFILFSAPQPKWDAMESQAIDKSFLRSELPELSVGNSLAVNSHDMKSSNSNSLKSYLESVFDGLALPDPVLPGQNPDGSPRYVPYISVDDFRERLGDNRYAKRLLNRFVKSDRLLFFPGNSTVDPVPEPATVVFWSIAVIAGVSGQRLRKRSA